MDFFVVPTIGFDLLYAFVIVRIDRRDLVWINVTKNPTAEWVTRQITEAFPWDGAPGYTIRDCDRIYGGIVTRRLRAMGIRDKPTSPASPWQNGFAEQLIGSIRAHDEQLVAASVADAQLRPDGCMAWVGDLAQSVLADAPPIAAERCGFAARHRGSRAGAGVT